MNAKTYCVQAKKKWKDLQGRAHQLDAEYDKKIEELGTICSTMFKEIKDPQISREVNQELEQQMGENKQKLDVLKRFVKEVNICLEKVSALEGENRADLLVMFNSRLTDYQVQAQKLEKVLSEMTIRRVIEESFGGDRGQREVEERILSGEDNQKSVNTYLIQKIHTLEDRVNAKFDHEKSQLSQISKIQKEESQRLIDALKDRDLKVEKSNRELKS